jgi:hypothetical protein
MDYIRSWTFFWRESGVIGFLITILYIDLYIYNTLPLAILAIPFYTPSGPFIYPIVMIIYPIVFIIH